MKLTLARHGQPIAPANDKIFASEMEMWIDAYNQAPMHMDTEPSAALMEVVSCANMVVCSDTRRSIESARILGAVSPPDVNAVYREADLPYGDVPLVKLKASQWAILFRLFWLLGYSNGSESFLKFRARATIAAGQLEQLVEEYESVVFIGHAILNFQISKYLKGRGWRGRQPASNYWSFGTFVHPRT